MTVQIPKIYMTLETLINGIRCQQNKYTTTQWKVEALLHAVNKDDEDEKTNLDMVTVKWQSLNFWFGLLEDIIIFDASNDEWALNSIKTCLPNNPIMTIPGFPTDDVIAVALTEKINTICDGHLYCTRVTLKSEEVGVKYTVVAEDNESILPGIEYIGEKPYESIPWWRRHDSQTFDINMSAEEEKSDSNVTVLKSVNKQKTDILLQFEHRIKEQLNRNSDPGAMFELIFDSEENVLIDPGNINNNEDEAETEIESEDDNSSNIIEVEWNRDK